MGEKANRGTERDEMKNVAFRAFGAGVMNNNLLLLPHIQVEQ